MNLESAKDKAIFIRDNYHQKGNFPNYEDVLEKTYNLFIRKGFKILDIGAHSGRHTEKFIDIAGSTGKIWAFEPLPHMASVLRSRFGHLENVSIEELAFSNTVKEAEYVFVKNAPEESGLQERIYNIPDPIIEKLKVSVSTVDTRFPDLTGVDYVKIDIEGGEIDCLSGMTQFLKRNRPYMSVEYGFPGYSKYGNIAETLFRTAEGYDMIISDMFGSIIQDVDEWNEVCDVATWDFFLVPRERVSGWRSYFSNTSFPDYFLPSPQ